MNLQGNTRVHQRGTVFMLAGTARMGLQPIRFGKAFLQHRPGLYLFLLMTIQQPII